MLVDANPSSGGDGGDGEEGDHRPADVLEAQRSKDGTATGVKEGDDSGHRGSVAEWVGPDDAVQIAGAGSGEQQPDEGKLGHDDGGAVPLRSPELRDHPDHQRREEGAVDDVVGAMGRVTEVGHAQVDDVDGDEPDDPGDNERGDDVEGEDGRGSHRSEHVACGERHLGLLLLGRRRTRKGRARRWEAPGALRPSVGWSAHHRPDHGRPRHHHHRDRHCRGR